MKKLLLLFLMVSICATLFAQRPHLPQRKDVIAPMVKTTGDPFLYTAKGENPVVSTKSILVDPQLMMTNYDLQTNSSSGQQRLYLYPDGSMVGIATMSHENGGAYSDRGTGYNFRSTSQQWGAMPTTRVESTRTGWPSYQPFEANGEIVVAHQVSPNPIKICRRSTRGSGTWTESTLPIPSGVTTMWWPRMVTNGPNHTYIHVIALTLPTGNGGTVYNGMDGALLYVHSLDGGNTWSNWQQLPGMTSAEYINFSADAYAWAEPVGNTIAFSAGDSWQDQILMKSTDNGTTWTKTMVHNSLYNLGGASPNFFYCPDGGSAIALDNEGMAHIVFGLQSDSGTNVPGSVATYWRPFTQGVVYWNEYMPALRQDLDPDSLEAHGQLIGWIPDTNVFYQPATSLAHYYNSMTGNPSIHIDNNNEIIVVWAGVTMLLDPSGYMLRHIFSRLGLVETGGVVFWDGSFWQNRDLTSDFLYNFAECMYPDISPNSTYSGGMGNGEYFVLFQADDIAGSYVKGTGIAGYQGQTSVSDNFMTMVKDSKLWYEGIDPHSVNQFNCRAPG